MGSGTGEQTASALYLIEAFLKLCNVRHQLVMKTFSFDAG